MKRILALSFCLLYFMGSAYSQISQDKKVIAVLSASKDIPAGVSLSPMVNQFIDALLQSTERQYRVVDRSEEFRRFIEQERDYQASGVVDKVQMARIGKELGAKYVCGLYVEYSPADQDYYFQSRILDVENNDIIGNADYPNEIEGEKKIKSLERFYCQGASLHLIRSLGFMSVSQQNDWNRKVSDFDSEFSTREENARRAEQDRTRQAQDAQLAQEKRDRQNATRQSVKETMINIGDFLKPYYGAHLLLGGPIGFQLSILFDVKYVSLGIGVGLLSEEAFFPIQGENVEGGKFTVAKEKVYNADARYYLSSSPLNFSVGLNFKYFGFAIRPIIYRMVSKHDSPTRGVNYNYDEYYKYISSTYPQTLIGYTPTLYVHIPFGKVDYGLQMGIIGSIGYTTTIKEIQYSPGFQFGIGMSIFW